jgi:hypothetical protein
MQFRQWKAGQWIVTRAESGLRHHLFSNELICSVFQKASQVDTYCTSPFISELDVIPPARVSVTIRVKPSRPMQRVSVTTLKYAIDHYWCTFSKEQALDDLKGLQWEYSTDYGMPMLELIDDVYFDVLLPRSDVRINANVVTQVNDILFESGKLFDLWEREEGEI